MEIDYKPIRKWYLNKIGTATQDMKTPVKFIKRRGLLTHEILIELRDVFHEATGIDIFTGEQESE